MAWMTTSRKSFDFCWCSSFLLVSSFYWLADLVVNWRSRIMRVLITCDLFWQLNKERHTMILHRWYCHFLVEDILYIFECCGFEEVCYQVVQTGVFDDCWYHLFRVNKIFDPVSAVLPHKSAQTRHSTIQRHEKCYSLCRWMPTFSFFLRFFEWNSSAAVHMLLE